MVKPLTLACAAALLVAGCGPEQKTPEGQGYRGVVLKPAKQVSGVKVDSIDTGKPTRVSPEAGKYSLIYFGYLSCPDVCPTSMADLSQAIERQRPSDRERLTPGFISVDPDRDTPRKMKQYMKLFFKRYNGFRPQGEQLENAQKAFGADSKIGKKEKNGSYPVSHSAYIYLVDSEGKVLVEWPFQTPAEDMAHDIRLALRKE